MVLCHYIPSSSFRVEELSSHRFSFSNCVFHVAIYENGTFYLLSLTQKYRILCQLIYGDFIIVVDDCNVGGFLEGAVIVVKDPPQFRKPL